MTEVKTLECGCKKVGDVTWLCEPHGIESRQRPRVEICYDDDGNLVQRHRFTTRQSLIGWIETKHD